jgi:hypothetical protein
MALLLGLIIIIKMCRSDLYDYQVHIMVVLAYFSFISLTENLSSMDILLLHVNSEAIK